MSFDGLLKNVYHLMARKRLDVTFSGFREDTRYAEFFNLIEDIRSYKDLLSYSEMLPTNEERENIIKAKIRADFENKDDEVKRLADEREKDIENAEMDYGIYKNALITRYQGMFGSTTSNPTVTNKAEFDSFVDQLKENLGSELEQILTPSHGIRKGDRFTVSKMEGMDLDTFEPNYHFGGDENLIPIGTEGAVSKVLNKEHIIGDINGVTSHFLPTEIEFTGKNDLMQIVSKNGGYSGAAGVIIDQMLEEAKPHAEKEIKSRIERLYAQKIAEVLKSVEKKYSLSTEQITALSRGEDFSYRTARLGQFEHIEMPWDRVAEIGKRYLEFRTKKKVIDPKNVGSEKAFFDYMLKAVKTLKIRKSTEFAEQITFEVGSLLEKQHYLKEREIRVHEENIEVMDKVLDYLLRDSHEGETWLRRLMLYNDRNLFKGGDPFAPPSEELPRVIKLETGNGCNYAKCTFCTEYAKASFFITPPDEFVKHAKEVRKRLDKDTAWIQRVFLGGGNTFQLPTKQLIKYLEVVDELFNRQEITGLDYYPPRFEGRNNIRRVEAFSRTEGILNKSVNELETLYDHNLKLIYWGAESGSQQILDYVNKGITIDKMYKAVDKINETDIWVSIMIMPGLGGIRFYEEHVEKTVQFLNHLRPRFTTFHTITPKPGAKYIDIMNEEMEAGKNRPLTDEEVVEQMHDIISGMRDGYRSLVATYYPPSAKIAVNPVSFRGYFHRRNGKNGILSEISDWYSDHGKVPSLAIPETGFNKDSRLRRMARESAQ